MFFLCCYCCWDVVIVQNNKFLAVAVVVDVVVDAAVVVAVVVDVVVVVFVIAEMLLMLYITKIVLLLLLKVLRLRLRFENKFSYVFTGAKAPLKT